MVKLERHKVNDRRREKRPRRPTKEDLRKREYVQRSRLG